MSDQDPFPDLDQQLSRVEQEGLVWLIAISAVISILGLWKLLELVGVL